MISLQSLYSCLPDQKKIDDPSQMISHSFELYENIPKEQTLFDRVVDNKTMDDEMKKVNETASVNKPVVKITEIMKKVNYRENLVNFVVKDKFVESSVEVNGIYDKNVMRMDTFFMSILAVMDDKFLYLDADSKKNLVVQLRTKMASHLVEKDLYKKFGYDLNAKVSKRRLQQQLMNFKNNSDVAIYMLLGQFLADYFQLDFVIYREESKSVKYYIASQLNKQSGDIPYIVLYQTKHNNFIVLRTGETGIFKWGDNIFNLAKPSRLDVDKIRSEKAKQKEVIEISDGKEVDDSKIPVLLERDLKKLKLDDLKKLLEERDISLTKKSEKTNKDIKKTKQDMIDDLMAI